MPEVHQCLEALQLHSAVLHSVGRRYLALQLEMLQVRCLEVGTVINDYCLGSLFGNTSGTV